MNNFPYFGNTSLTFWNLCRGRLSLDTRENQTTQCQLSQLRSTLADLNYGPWQENPNVPCVNVPSIILPSMSFRSLQQSAFQVFVHIWKAQFQRPGFSHPCQYHRLKCDTGTWPWLHTFFKPEPIILQNVRVGTLSSHTLKWKVCWYNPISSRQRSPCNVAQWW